MTEKINVISVALHTIYDENGSPMNLGRSYFVKRSNLINSYLEEGLLVEDPDAQAPVEEEKPTPAKTNRKSAQPTADDSQENLNA